MESSQLIMVRKDLEDIPDAPLPEGYRTRTYEDGDEHLLEPLFQQCFDFGWSADRIVKTFLEDRAFSPMRFCVLCRQDEVIGIAGAWEGHDRPGHGMVQPVAVMPPYRRKGLGRTLLVRVLQLLKQMGYSDAWLLTDDSHLGAIQLYLWAGFKPVSTNPSDRERWQIIRHKLEAMRTD